MTPPRTRSTPGDADAGGQTPAGASLFSIELAVRDHARLAERLADHIGRLRQARSGHRDVDATRNGLHAFLTDDLIPYLHTEEAVLDAGSVNLHRPGWPGTAAQRRTRRRLRDHRRIITAADAARSAETTPLALARAERVRALLDKHLAREDRELLAAAGSRSDDGPRPASSVALATELQEILVQDHVRIAGAITLARDTAADAPDRLDACDHATAALSQHAAVMSTRAYPMARCLLPGPERAAIRSLRDDLRNAERALRHLNRTLRGAAGEDSDNRERLWDEVEQAWHRHVADEERLTGSLARLLRPDQALSLIARLRRPAGRSLTRQHPALLRGGWPTRMAIHAQHRIDRWRDVLDNRESSRSGS
jgi:Hemerythrin HHE cation binding domain